MPKVRARHRGCLGDRDGERAPSPATLRPCAAICALERLESRSPCRFSACAARPSGPLFRERREKTATLAKCFRRIGDRAPRRARRPPRRATRPLSSAGTDIIRPRPRRNAAEANPRASPSRCSAPTSTCPSTTSRGRYGRDAPRRSTVARKRSADSRAVSTVETRGRRLTVTTTQISSRGFNLFFLFVSPRRDETETDRRPVHHALKTKRDDAARCA